MGAKEEVVAGDEGWVTNCDCASDEVEVDDVCSDMLGSWAETIAAAVRLLPL